jgi:hypothetical protein
MQTVRMAPTIGVVCLLIAGLSGCDNHGPAKPPVSPTSQDGASSETPSLDFSKRLLEIAGAYKKYAAVDAPGVMKWAPTRCVAPFRLPRQPQLSESDDESAHGRKLYFLFAAELAPYQKAQQEQNPIGQVLVKESWTAEEISADTFASSTSPSSREPTSPYAMHNDKYYKAGQRRELFIMFKTDPKTPDTDNGWVYGTVSADGREVTATGRIESCMQCHREAGQDRLFGPKYPDDPSSLRIE